MFQRSIIGLIFFLVSFTVSAEDLGIIVAKPNVNLPTVDVLSVIGADFYVNSISVGNGTNLSDYLRRVEAFQIESVGSILTLGVDHIDQNLLGALSKANGLSSSIRLPLPDLSGNLVLKEKRDLYVILPSVKQLTRTFKGPWNMGFFPIGEEISVKLLLYNGNAKDDDGCGCEDSRSGPYMACDPDGAFRSDFADYLSHHYGCGGDCENGRFVPYSEFKKSSLYNDLILEDWRSEARLNELSAAGELVYVFMCDPD